MGLRSGGATATATYSKYINVCYATWKSKFTSTELSHFIEGIELTTYRCTVDIRITGTGIRRSCNFGI